MDVIIVKVNLCRINENEAKMEFAFKGSISKKERRSYSSRINDVRSIVDTSNLYLGGIEIEVTSDNITCGRVYD